MVQRAFTGRPRAIEEHLFLDDGLVPNNPRLALRLYRCALPWQDARPEQAIIDHFAGHGWTGAWVDGIYDFHHYHATVHEVLGLARGWAEVRFGGPKGVIVTVEAGDAVLIPAGVGHCRIDAGDDLAVVGAYPGGMAPDLQRATPAARVASLARIAATPPWPRDPVTGEAG